MRFQTTYFRMVTLLTDTMDQAQSPEGISFRKKIRYVKENEF